MFRVRQDKEVTTVGANYLHRHEISVGGVLEFPRLPRSSRTLGRPNGQLVLPIAVALLVALAVNLAPTTGLRVNLSRSMPRGLYRLTDGVAHGGALIAFCIDDQVAVIALARSYVGAGSCPDGVEPLLKHVVAEGGDVVTTTESAVAVNGIPLANSATLRADSDGRPLPHHPWGRRRLSRGELWVFSSAAHSWDSRYFGPISTDQVTAIAEPLFTID